MGVGVTVEGGSPSYVGSFVEGMKVGGGGGAVEALTVVSPDWTT